MRVWQEVEPVTEKGSRIVRCIIRDTTGNSIAAVAGTERSINPMVYEVSNDFLRVFGFTEEIHAGTKWRTAGRRKMWPHDARSLLFQVFNPTPTADYLIYVMAHWGTRRSRFSAGEGSSKNQSVEQTRNISWLGSAWVCNNQFRHYSAFCRDDTVTPVHSFAWIKGENGKHCVGYLLDLYETQLEQKMVKVRWFHFPDQIKDPTAILNTDPRELFITRLEQDVRADCVDGLVAVLTPTHFNKCLGSIKELPFDTFMCRKEVQNGRFEPYSINILRGYSAQPVVTYLICQLPRRVEMRNSPEEMDDDAPEKPYSSKRAESIGNDLTLEGGKDAPPTSGADDSQLPRKKLRFKLPSTSPATADKFVVPKPLSQASVDVNIELLSLDSGMRGCWFRCKVLQSKPKRLKVQYCDVYDAEEPKNLEEWVPASRVAHPDTLGLRCAGRLTVRPWPTENTPQDHVFEVGAAVDAWWCDGWWEGVVIGCDTLGTNNLQIYFPGEKRFLSIERKNIRVSRDWFENKWVDVKSKPDILSYLTSG